MIIAFSIYKEMRDDPGSKGGWEGPGSFPYLTCCAKDKNSNEIILMPIT